MSEFETTAQGCWLASPVSVLTGRCADIIIIDDPLKPEEALSQAQRHAANDWFDELGSHSLTRRCGEALMIENGFGHLPKEAGWLAEYVHELTGFAKGKHHDQVDFTA